MRFAWLFLAIVGAAGCGAGQLTGTHLGEADGAPGPDPGADAAPGSPDAAPGTPDAAPPPPHACKRGVAYNNENGADAPALAQGVGWWYDWGPAPGNDGASTALRNAGLEFVPMIWTGPPRGDIDVNAIVAQIPPGAKYLLGFNEPNFGNQANLTPQQAAAAWPLVEQIADARGLKIVSPALNYCGGNCNETDPFVWMDAFLAACSGCRIDYVALHWYACDKSALSYILGKYEAYGKPVWLTEFACLDASDTSVAAQTTYMNDAVPLLEQDPKVFRYSWFIGRGGGEPDNLLGAPGTLTSLGQAYVGFAGACTP